MSRKTLFVALCAFALGVVAALAFSRTRRTDAPARAGRTEQGADVAELQRRVELLSAELEQAKNKITSHIVLQSERSASRLFAVGNNWIQRGGYRSVQEVVQAYRAVTRDSIGAVVEKYPLTENTTVVIGPLAEVPAPTV